MGDTSDSKSAASGRAPVAAPEALPASPSSESRKHLRFTIDDASTSFSIKGVSTSLGEGRVNRTRAAINLSEGGTMLLLSEAMPVGTPIRVRIEIDGYADTVQAAGVVRWCEQGPQNSREFRAGVEFVDLKPEDVRKITRMQEWTSSPEYRSRRHPPRPQ